MEFGIFHIGKDHWNPKNGQLAICYQTISHCKRTIRRRYHTDNSLSSLFMFSIIPWPCFYLSFIFPSIISLRHRLLNQKIKFFYIIFIFVLLSFQTLHWFQGTPIRINRKINTKQQCYLNKTKENNVPML